MYKGRRDIALFTLNLGTRLEVRVQPVAPAVLSSRKLPVPTEEEVEWDKDWSGGRKDTLMLEANYMSQSKVGKTGVGEEGWGIEH